MWKSRSNGQAARAAGADATIAYDSPTARPLEHVARCLAELEERRAIGKCVLVP